MLIDSVSLRFLESSIALKSAISWVILTSRKTRGGARLGSREALLGVVDESSHVLLDVDLSLESVARGSMIGRLLRRGSLSFRGLSRAAEHRIR